MSRHVIFDETQFSFKKITTGADLAAYSQPNLTNWLPLLPHPNGAGKIHHHSHTTTAAVDPAITTHRSRAPIESLPISNPSNPFSGPSAPTADPNSSFNLAPLMVGSIPILGPFQVGADQGAPLLTYHRRFRATDTSTPAADPTQVKYYSRPPNKELVANPPTPNREHAIPSTPIFAKHSLQETQSTHPLITRSHNPNLHSNQVALLTESFIDTKPKTYNQAKNHSHWVEAMNK